MNIYRGLNSRLDEIQAAVLRVKLKRLDDDNQRRREIAQYYFDNIKNGEIILPSTHNSQLTADFSHVWHLFVIRTSERDRLQNYLTEKGIQTLIHYPIPPHKQLAYKEMNGLKLVVTEKIHNEVLSLPISSVLLNNEMERIVSVINEFKIK